MERQLHLFVGGLFSLIGLVLVAYGWTSDPSLYGRSFGWNVNLWWGLVMSLFGGSFLTWWRRSGR